MCGISGIINKNKQSVEAIQIQSMNDIIAHRGPDADGFYFDLNLAFGHRRLSILDLSELGSQPMHFATDYTITYNGEVYNYIEIREVLIANKYSFKSNSDTEVILAAYDFWGEDCVNHFNGMWSFAIHDKKKNIVFCSRDRFGIKPFYYFEDENKFYFGSEIKQLLPFLKERKCNKQIALDYLIAGIEEYNNETFFDGVKKLLGGNNLIFNLENLTYEIKKYYQIEIHKEIEKSDFDQAKLLYQQELERSIKIRMRSDVKVGTCLSGGIDSSAIASLASQKYENAEKFNAIHASSTEKATNETNFAEMAANHCDLNLQIIQPSLEYFKNNVEKIIEIQEEPFGSPSIIMQYFVFKKAREINCIVMLDGQGGDETLLGYERYYPALIKSLKGVEKIKAIINSSKNSKLSILQTLKFQYYFTNYKLRLKRLKKRNAHFKSEILSNYHSDIIKKISNSYSNINELQKLEINSTQLPHLLKYEDKNSMANSIESRLPFLDYKVLETALSLNYKHKIHEGWTKYILRKIISPILPKEIVWRKNKLGFNAPEKSWLIDFQNEMIKAINDSILLKEFIDFSNFNFQKLDLRTKWRLYNFAKWEQQFQIKH